MAAFTPLKKSVGTVTRRAPSSLSNNKRAFESFPMSLSLFLHLLCYISVHEYLEIEWKLRDTFRNKEPQSPFLKWDTYTISRRANY